VPIHPAGNLVDGVVTAYILGVAERRAFPAQHAAVDSAGLEVERGHGVDRVRHLVQPGCAQFSLGKFDAFDCLEQIAECRALRAAGCLCALLQLMLEIGVVLSPDHHDLQIVVIFDLGDDIVVFQHVLVEQVAQREVFWMVSDRHHGDDLLSVQVERQRPLHRHLDLDIRAGLVDADDALGQP
jgi:hypothetical protein